MTDHFILAASSRDAAGAPDTKSFRGDFVLSFRCRRQTFAEVEAVAQALLEVFPDDVFRIEQQIARVKMKPTGVHPNE